MESDNIDREKTCPLLLRCFWSTRPGHSAASYRDASRLPESEVQIYTWKNATLREITDLLREVILQSLSSSSSSSNTSQQQQHRLLRHVTLTYSLVYPDRGRNNAIAMRTIGRVQSFRSGADDSLTLAGVKFVTGDYLDVSVDVNNSTTAAISTAANPTGITNTSTSGGAGALGRRGGGGGRGADNYGGGNSNNKRAVGGASDSGPVAIDYGHGGGGGGGGDAPWRKRNRRF